MTKRDIVIACCRDEADIIRDFIEYYLDLGFDHVFIYDNGSRDNSVSIIRRNFDESVVTVREDPRPGYDARLLEIYKSFVAPNDRWTFFVDVDEFVGIPGGIKAYADELDPAVEILELPVFEMFPDFDATPSQHPLLSTTREMHEQTERKVVWQNGDVRKIYCGKHDIERNGGQRLFDERCFVLHYHTRSIEQLERKVANRIETERAISAQERRDLSLFSEEQVEGWLERSAELLAGDGWTLEKERCATVDSTRETTVCEWFSGRRRKVGP